MKQSRRDILASESVGRLLFRLAAPATVGMMVNALYNVVDTYFVGRGVGALAIGGLAIAFPLQILVFGVGLLLGTGAASIISRALGAGDAERAQRTAGNMYTIGIITALVFLGLGRGFIDEILTVFGATEALLPYAREYVSLILFGAPFIILAVASNNMVRAEGRAGVSMMAMMLGAGSNIVLDYVFIMVLGMGIRGAALATVLGRFLAFAFLLVYLTSPRTGIRLRLRYVLPDFRLIARAAALGVPAFVRNIGGTILAITVNNVLRAYGGDMHIAAFGIINRILIFGLMPILGVNQGFQPMAGFNYGAKRFDRVRRSLRVAAVVCTVISVSLFALLMAAPRSILGIFSTNEQLLSVGTEALRWVAFALPLVGVQIVGATFFLAIGKAVPSLFLSMSRQIVFLIPLVLVLPRFWGLSGVWYAFPVADVLAVCVTGIWLSRELRGMERSSSPAGGTGNVPDAKPT